MFDDDDLSGHAGLLVGGKSSADGRRHRIAAGWGGWYDPRPVLTDRRQVLLCEDLKPTLHPNAPGGAIDSRKATVMSNSNGETTLIGKGIKINGQITGQASIEIFGELEGTAGTEGTFRVREGGKVQGEVAARHVIVDGELVGQIAAEEKIELHATSKVTGDIQAKTVTIAEGALFEGSVKMRDRTK
jgi:cytoskeletal protein CcmA (bactofilin family)